MQADAQEIEREIRSEEQTSLRCFQGPPCRWGQGLGPGFYKPACSLNVRNHRPGRLGGPG